MTWGLVGLFVVLLGIGVYVIWGILSEDAPKKKNTVATISLVKPPPTPPPIKEKPPEQQIQQQKKEEFISEGPKDQAKGPDRDDTPAGDKLGLDAEGKAGGDAFGLAGRKGGRSLLAGGGLGSSQMKKFAWYHHMAEAEIRKRVLKILDDQGGIPGGKLQAIVDVYVSDTGVITSYKITGSSGNHRMDDAIKKVLSSSLKVGDAPPEGMDRVMTIRVFSKG